VTTERKCEVILQVMLHHVNRYLPVALEHDFGQFTATIRVGVAHTHVGCPGEEGTWVQFIDELYNQLTGGPGLSWVDAEGMETLQPKKVEKK